MYVREALTPLGLTYVTMCVRGAHPSRPDLGDNVCEGGTRPSRPDLGDNVCEGTHPSRPDLGDNV